MEELFISDAISDFKMYKDLSDRAVGQLPQAELLFRLPSPGANSVAVIMKHLGGNLISRWTNFLSTDGEKPDRDRDSEFAISEKDTAEHIKEIWEAGWSALFATFEILKPEDLNCTIRIRNEPIRIPRAILRSLTHTAYHSGQIVYLCRSILEEDWKWLSIPPGMSASYTPEKK